MAHFVGAPQASPCGKHDHMKFSIKRKDLKGETLELERSPVSGRVKASLDGKSLERLNEKNRPFDLITRDNKHHKLYVRARWLDPVPVVHIDDEEIKLAENLRAIDYFFGCFPIIMFLAYGALSTLVAFFLMMGNFRILRSKMSPTMKWATIYAMDLAVFLAVVAIVKFVISAGK